MIKSSAEKGHINEMDIIMETMCSMKRAGANAIEGKDVSGAVFLTEFRF